MSEKWIIVLVVVLEIVIKYVVNILFGLFKRFEMEGRKGLALLFRVGTLIISFAGLIGCLYIGYILIQIFINL